MVAKRVRDDASEGGFRLAKKARADNQPGKPSACSGGAGEPWMRAIAARPPPVAVGRNIGGWPSADHGAGEVYRLD